MLPRSAAGRGACLAAALCIAGLTSTALADSPSTAGISTARTQAGDVPPPQVLGLVAAVQPIPLVCAGGSCTALLSSFCLQQDRPAPAAGQDYDVAGAGDVTLVVRRTDGSVTEFSAAGLLRYVSDGGFTRIRVELPEKRLASLDAAAVAVRVAPLVSLLPRTDMPPGAAVAARDAEAAEGAPRLAAEAFFAPGTPRADAAVTMARLLDQLPATGPVRSQPAAAVAAAGDSAWRKVETAGGLAGLSADGVARAKAELDRCGAFAEMGFKLTLQGCVSKSHDRTLREINDELWKSQPGY